MATRTKRAASGRKMLAPQPLDPPIVEIRGQSVIVDRDLAELYGVTTGVLNQAVKRNWRRFPKDFVFRLNHKEAEKARRSRSQIVILKRGQNIKYLPYAFTEHGAVMAANVLNSERAVAMSVYVVRAFVKLREVLASTAELAKKLDILERKLSSRLDVHEKAIVELFAQMRKLLKPSPPQPEPKRRPIGF